MEKYTLPDVKNCRTCELHIDLIAFYRIIEAIEEQVISAKLMNRFMTIDDMNLVFNMEVKRVGKYSNYSHSHIYPVVSLTYQGLTVEHEGD